MEITDLLNAVAEMVGLFLVPLGIVASGVAIAVFIMIALAHAVSEINQDDATERG